MSVTRLLRQSSLCSLWLLCCTLRLAAQATSGSIEGFITDPSGGRVPDARIVVREESSGVEKTAYTNGLGAYAIAGLPPGQYRISATKNGFQTFVSPPAELAIDQKLRADAALLLGAVDTAPVQVMDSSLQTQTVETGETIRSRQILDLPLLGRNFLELSLLTAGVAGASGGNTLNLAVNGQREFANSILIDGVEASANRNNDTTLRPSVDSVEEFKILTSAYSAEFGRASGAVIAIETRSGSNRFHGSLYEFFRPNVTAARTFFAPVASPLKQHNFGGTAGGPVRKNRTFFFASYEEARIRTAYSFLDSVPPAGQIRVTPDGAVDLSGLKDPFGGNQVPIFDPNFYAANYYSSPFPGNVIPASRVSPAGKAVLQQLFPSPTLPGIYNGWYSNFDSTQAVRFQFARRGRPAGPRVFGKRPAQRGVPFQCLRFHHGRPVRGPHSHCRRRRRGLRRPGRLAQPAVGAFRGPHLRRPLAEPGAFRLHPLSPGSAQPAEQPEPGVATRHGERQSRGFPPDLRAARYLSGVRRADRRVHLTSRCISWIPTSRSEIP